MKVKDLDWIALSSNTNSTNSQ